MQLYRSTHPNQRRASQCDPNARSFNWRDVGMVTPIRDQRRLRQLLGVRQLGRVRKQLPDREQFDAGRFRARRDGLRRLVERLLGRKLERRILLHRGGRRRAAEFAAVCGEEPAMPLGDCAALSRGRLRRRSAPTGKHIPSPKEIKSALCEHGPLYTGIIATNTFMAYAGGVLFASRACRFRLGGRPCHRHRRLGRQQACLAHQELLGNGLGREGICLDQIRRESDWARYRVDAGGRRVIRRASAARGRT